MADEDMGNAHRVRGEPHPLGRYLRLGLSTNPFFHTTLADGGPAGEGSMLARRLLDDSRWRVVELQGEKGAGKTHTLRWLLARLARDPEASYRHLPEPERVRVPPAACRVFALDEAQRARPRDLAALGAWARRGDNRLLLGTHEPRIADLGWAPSDPGVRRVLVDRLDRTEAEGWVRDRLAQASVPGRTVGLAIQREGWGALFEVARENFLRFTDVLYQVGQRLPEDGKIGADLVYEAAARLDEAR